MPTRNGRIELPATSLPVDIGEIAERYIAAWSSREPEAILALHSEDSTFEVHGRGVRAAGKLQLAEEFQAVFARYPEFGAQVHRLLLGDRHWLLDWTLTFRLDGEPRAFRCIDVVEVSPEGLVTRKDTFYDYSQAQSAMAGATS